MEGGLKRALGVLSMSFSGQNLRKQVITMVRMNGFSHEHVHISPHVGEGNAEAQNRSPFCGQGQLRVPLS